MNFRPVVLLFFLTSCASLPDPQRDWDQVEVLRAMDQGVLLVDLRTPSEAASGRLPGALLVDYWSPDFERFLGSADPTQSYLVYCSHGVRGRQAVERMRAAGFVDVYNLAGGLSAWKDHP